MFHIFENQLFFNSAYLGLFISIRQTSTWNTRAEIPLYDELLHDEYLSSA